MKYVTVVAGITVIGLVLSQPQAFNTVIGALSNFQNSTIKALQMR